MKTEIRSASGEPSLQPRAALNAARAANDRLNYFFSLLQQAAEYAAHPHQSPPGLQRERIAYGIDEPDCDTITAHARMAGNACQINGAAGILLRVVTA